MSTLRVNELFFHGIGPVNFVVTANQCVCISGTSGSGKTLLLRAIADLDAHKGTVFLDDVACIDVPPAMWRKQVGMLMADSQWWRDSVGEHFSQVNHDWLAMLGFDASVLDWPVSRLSMGERQRLAMVRLLCNYPKVLLLDEPTANLDADNTQQLEKLIKCYQQEMQAAVVCVTHNAAQIQRLADYHFQLEGRQLITREVA